MLASMRPSGLSRVSKESRFRLVALPTALMRANLLGLSSGGFAGGLWDVLFLVAIGDWGSDA